MPNLAGICVVAVTGTTEAGGEGVPCYPRAPRRNLPGHEREQTERENILLLLHPPTA